MSAPRPPLPGGPYLVVGLARSGVAAASALRRLGESVIGVDSGEPEGAERLRQEGAEVHLASDGLGLLGRARTVVKSPGVPQSAPAIVGAHAQGTCVIGELELGWRLLPNETIAVTGTNGKTTTVELIAHIHREAGRAVAAAGNVGVAISSLAGRIDPTVTIVCEASSFQLEDTVAFAPEAALLLNLTPDHLDRHASFEDYATAKLHTFSRQREGDLAVLPADPPGAGLDLAGRPIATASIEARIARLGGRARVVRFGQLPIEPAELRIVGAHNVQNAMAAATVCLERGIEVEAVRAGLRSFLGVRHRLEQIGRRSGVLYVNDSKATNVASAVVALQALAGSGQIHLIAGGQGKGQDFSALRAPVQAACAGVYLIGEDAVQIEAALAGIDVPVQRCGDLETAVQRGSAAARQAIAAARWVSAARHGPQAASQAHAGQGKQVVLLAPGCASFDQFTSFEARGDRFGELVAELPFRGDEGERRSGED
jgi:UDP-N-acetylmuramoylalanine--D-glutamate ligase